MAKMSSRFAQTFTTQERDVKLDLSDYVGQRSSTFRFDVVDGITGMRLGNVTPIRDSVPSLSHDTTRTIKRTLTMAFGKSDTAQLNAITDRIHPYMVFADGVEFPLGKYMFSDLTRQKFTSGKLSDASLIDESFIIDQPIERSFTVGDVTEGEKSGSILQYGLSVNTAINRLLRDVNMPKNFEQTNISVTGDWSFGTSRMKIFEDLATQGGFFSPWVDNTGTLRLIVTFEPNDRDPEFDFDASNAVKYGSVAESDDLLTAPNRIIVVNNQASTLPVYGTYDIPTSAPHSIFNRGFVIADIREMQVLSSVSANIVARNIGIRETVFESVTLNTAPDPRFDSYNVIKWDNAKWLELAWSMQLIEGGDMQHVIRKTYGS